MGDGVHRPEEEREQPHERRGGRSADAAAGRRGRYGGEEPGDGGVAEEPGVGQRLGDALARHGDARLSRGAAAGAPGEEDVAEGVGVRAAGEAGRCERLRVGEGHSEQPVDFEDGACAGREAAAQEALEEGCRKNKYRST